MDTKRELMKQQAARAALRYIEDNTIVGVGTGSTADYFIEALASIKGRIDGAVASSQRTAEQLKKHGIPVLDLNVVDDIPVYVDGTDEVNPSLQLIKGGGGALTREKIVAAVAKCFICIADSSKSVEILGTFPLPVEVIPMARSFVAREIVKLGGDPAYRENFITDNGNIILDVHNLQILEPIQLEKALNNIPGIVCNGLFAIRPADFLLIGKENTVETIKNPHR